MVNLTIEGREVSVPAGTSILEAAKYAGVLVPHYCYHPGLPVAGVCRMCLVEVEKAPKLAPVVRDGGRRRAGGARPLARRRSRRARACSRCCSSIIRSTARSAIRRASASCRTTRTRKGAPKDATASRSASIRSRISAATCMYMPNRCILCTRCVRFMDDVAHDPVLNVSERGDRAFIGKFEGQRPDAPVGGERDRPLPGGRARSPRTS